MVAQGRRVPHARPGRSKRGVLGGMQAVSVGQCGWPALRRFREHREGSVAGGESFAPQRTRPPFASTLSTPDRPKARKWFFKQSLPLGASSSLMAVACRAPAAARVRRRRRRTPAHHAHHSLQTGFMVAIIVGMCWPEPGEHVAHFIVSAPPFLLAAPPPPPRRRAAVPHSRNTHPFKTKRSTAGRS